MAADDGVQYASSRRGELGDYPAEWGMPPGGRFSEERAAWVRTHARRWQLDPLRRLRKFEVRQLNELRLRLVARQAVEGEEIERLLRAKGHLD
jgi:hypothetical protein